MERAAFGNDGFERISEQRKLSTPMSRDETCSEPSLIAKQITADTCDIDSSTLEPEPAMTTSEEDKL